MADLAIVDVDGTLVDTNYHHTLAWCRAFRSLGLVIPAWRIHRHIGMGGDQLVAALAGDDVEEQHGDALRTAWTAEYEPMLGEIVALPGARGLLVALRRRGHRVVLASSGEPAQTDHYLDLLDARPVIDDWTTSKDVEQTKPAPDLLQAAVDKVGGGDRVMVGDSVWDCVAAARLGVPSVAVRSGGFAEAELREAGATGVFDSVEDLTAGLDGTPLSGSGGSSPAPR